MIMQIFLSWEKLRAKKKCAYIKFNNILIKCLLVAYLAAFVMSGFLFNYVLLELKRNVIPRVLPVLRFAGGKSVKAATEIWKLDRALFGIYSWVALFFSPAHSVPDCTALSELSGDDEYFGELSKN